MMQALNGLQTPEEKIALLCKKYADLLDQEKLLHKQIRISQRKQVSFALLIFFTLGQFSRVLLLYKLLIRNHNDMMHCLQTI